MFEGVLNTPLEYEGRKQDALHKLTKFHLLSRCGKSVETQCKLCVSTKFSHKQIRWNFVILRSDALHKIWENTGFHWPYSPAWREYWNTLYGRIRVSENLYSPIFCAVISRNLWYSLKLDVTGKNCSMVIF